MRTLKDLIKPIFLFYIIVIITFILLMFYLDTEQTPTLTGLGITNRTVNLNILKDKIHCTDTINFNRTNQTPINYDFINNNQYLENVKIKINGKETYGLNWQLSKGYLPLSTLFKADTSDITIELTYDIGKDYITRYTDTDVISFFIDTHNLDYLNNLTINLSSEEPLMNLNVDKEKIENNNNTYSINFKNLNLEDFSDNPYIDFKFNILTSLNNTINSNFMSEKELSEMEEFSYIYDKEAIIVLFTTISILLFLVAFIINKKKIVSTYRKETSDLLSPIIAESILDGKIGLKELIMSTIIDLSTRGNIKIINNEKIELISLNNLETYEKNIVELIFPRKIMTFESINTIFTKSNIDALIFTKKMSVIRDSISNKLFSLDIFSRTLTKYNKIIKFFALLLTLNTCFVLLNFGLEGPIIAANFIFIIFYIKKYIFTSNSQKGFMFKPNRKLFSRILFFAPLFLFLIITASISIAKYYFEFFVIILLTLLLNLFTIHLCKDFALTPEGKKEQTKLMELRKYIIDYSLIKDRDLSSTIIWDKYLAYATAFGIPNKITDNIYDKNFYNLNLDIYILQHLL